MLKSSRGVSDDSMFDELFFIKPLQQNILDSSYLGKINDKYYWYQSSNRTVYSQLGSGVYLYKEGRSYKRNR